ncbi:MAG TPA: PaaI family thioesterase [Mycobacterium sp.]|jgi:acyl-coenzyme A thioesterase PaaI-like protein|nr:PaaI family thioesterase [Mycobacterium sp.]
MSTEAGTAALRAIYEPLADSVRRLIDISIRTEANALTVVSAKGKIDSAVAELSKSLTAESFGVRQNDDGQSMAWGNVLIGVRNPVAPPLVIHHDPGGFVWTDFELGAAYEGPAGHVHGGVCALILDHVLGATAHKPGKPAVTGTLTVRYLRGTPLGSLRAEANIERIEGVKTFAVGRISDASGVATVQAEGVFIHPRSRGL